MTTPFALGLFALLAVAAAIDLALGFGGALALAHWLLATIDWLAFWR